MYKCINKLAPDYLADKFVQRLPYPQSKHQIP